MKLLFIGDIVGRSGRKAVKQHLSSNSYDFVIGNVENSAGGFGITDKVYKELQDMGINAMTSGNHIWDKKETYNLIDTWDIFTRPANMAKNMPGVGYKIFNIDNKKICVINLIGRVFCGISNCPFEAFDEIYKHIPKDAFILVDLHAEATSEKLAFGHFAKGRANIVCGTHTHVQTNDLKMLDSNTLYLTDAGMCGAVNSCLGMEIESAVKWYITQM